MAEENTKTRNLTDEELSMVSGGTRYHTVVIGDTLWNIACHYHVTTDAILKANNISNANQIFTGMTLTILD